MHTLSNELLPFIWRAVKRSEAFLSRAGLNVQKGCLKPRLYFGDRITDVIYSSVAESRFCPTNHDYLNETNNRAFEFHYGKRPDF